MVVNVNGTAGNDVTKALIGQDAVYDGGAGYDRLSFLFEVGGVTASLKTGIIKDSGGGTDFMVNYESLQGSNFNDALIGDDNSNLLLGEGGDDFLAGGGGNDTLNGGNGADRLFGDAGSDRLVGGEGADQLSGGLDGDIIDGGLGSDIIVGDEGNDILRGNEDGDFIYGGAGNDKIYGGAGADFMRGDAGSDTFFVAAGDGTDVVYDFTQGEDKVDLTAFGTSFGALSVSMNGPHVVIDLGGGASIQLNHVDASALTAADFVF